MPYIDVVYYRDSFKGKMPNDLSTIDRELMRASDQIDILIGHKKVDMETTHPFIKQQVEKATASLAEYYIINGGYDVFIESQPVNVSLEGFSYSTDKELKLFPDHVIDILSGTGLLYSGMGVRDSAY